MYAPVVRDISSWLNYSKKSNWYNESINIYTTMTQPEDMIKYNIDEYQHNTGDLMYTIDTNGMIIPNNIQNNNSLSFAYPTFHVSPPPPPNASAYQNIDLASRIEYTELSYAAVALKG